MLNVDTITATIILIALVFGPTVRQSEVVLAACEDLRWAHRRGSRKSRLDSIERSIGNVRAMLKITLPILGPALGLTILLRY